MHLRNSQAICKSVKGGGGETDEEGVITLLPLE
jgi:hypothetical protein